MASSTRSLRRIAASPRAGSCGRFVSPSFPATDRKSSSIRRLPAPMASAVAVDANGTVYTASTVGHVFAIDGLTGRKVLDFDTTAPVWTAPAILPDGSLVVADRTGRVMLLGSPQRATNGPSS